MQCPPARAFSSSCAQSLLSALEPPARAFSSSCAQSLLGALETPHLLEWVQLTAACRQSKATTRLAFVEGCVSKWGGALAKTPYTDEVSCTAIMIHA